MRTAIIPIEQQFIQLEGDSGLDYRAICCFAATGFFLDDTTFHLNRKVKSPATDYNEKEEGSPYFEWHYTPRDISFNQAVDEFSTLFEEISWEHLEGKRIILPLSGGLDSRSQAAALKGFDNVMSYSYKFANSFDETKYGREIARKMGWEFKEYTIPRGYLWECIDKLSDLNGCYADFIAPRQMAISQDFKDMGDLFHIGHWGDVLFDDMGVPDNLPFDLQVSILKKKIIKKGGLELATALWRFWKLQGDFEDYIHEQLSMMLARIKIDNANARIRAFKSLYWAPRWTSINLSIFSNAHPLVVPYYDNRMCEFICGIPEKYLSGRKIQIEYIRRKAPELALIPWQSFDPCNLNNFEHYGSITNQSVVFTRKVIRRLTEIATGSVCTERNWEIQFLGSENDKHLRQLLLNNNGIAPRDICKEFYDKFSSGGHAQKVKYAHPLSMLLTLAQKNSHARI